MLAPGSYPPEVPMRLATGLFAFSSLVLVACGGGGGSGDDTGDDAPGPDADPGRQFTIVTPDTEILPGQEITYCYYTTVDIDEAVGVKEWSSTMSNGSHHLIVYFTDTALHPDGTMTTDCGGGTAIPYWTYSAGTPEYTNAMPEGVGMTVNAQQNLYVQLHYINYSPNQSLTASAEIRAEHYAAGEEYIPAAAFITFHTGISIPPNGTATATGTCTNVPTGQFFTLSTHAHRRAIHTQVNDGSTMVFESEDWEHPGATDWRASGYTFDGPLVYSCDYQNDLDQTVNTGDSAATDEMCMAVGYFYPAPGGPEFCISF